MPVEPVADVITVSEVHCRKPWARPSLSVLSLSMSFFEKHYQENRKRMGKTAKNKEVSIRVRFEQDILDRIDLLAESDGRQKFIRDAVLWKLDQVIPPVVKELVDDVGQLKMRVDHLERLESTSTYLAGMRNSVKNQVCRDDIDRNLLAHLLQHEGATTPELAESLRSKDGRRLTRRAILDRIDKLNVRAKKIIGVRVLKHERGLVKGKRGAWWLMNRERILGS